ncbi:hypothetical protein [Mycolicibacterium fortuitum]|uniref:DUF5666 domain-containing protein n=3 Tax=Mycolicibacterium fortuitum TaxID=1766 RepID=A0ABD6QIW5_MYCFO|nr:hypothetical protein [Mycolicibacterium fortuitum]MBP3086436.1 hypothetical protein [Mycolicibacterium fortuitum]OBI74182.1 hypothetical protein A5664_28020 [Mycolicibacterium fortuitum]OMC41587.1 hypothetical protein A5742_31765 [Mycolicibacterium fortuitum]
MSIRPTVAAVGIATAIAGLGGAAVYAATDTQDPGRHGPPPWMQGQSHERPDPATVHSEAVLTEGGGYRTALFQTGTITDLSATSVTVRSNDGFVQTYSLPDGAKPPFGVNDRVLVRGTRSGTAPQDKPTVTSIGEAPGPQPLP